MDPIQNSAPAQAPVAAKKSHTTAIIIALIVIVAVIAGFYRWGKQVDRDMAGQDVQAPALTSADDASTIEADLTATDISGGDFSDLNDIR